jgi:hypothetical protein
MRQLIELIDQAIERLKPRNRWKAWIWRDWMYRLPMPLRVRVWNFCFGTKLTVLKRT